MFEFSGALNCVDNSILEEEPIPEISLETKSNFISCMYLNTT